MIRYAIAALVILIAGCNLTGCATAPPVIRTQTVDVPTYIRVPVPAKLTQVIAYTPEARACMIAGKPAWCNGQVWRMWQEADDALARCNANLQIIGTQYGAKP